MLQESQKLPFTSSLVVMDHNKSPFENKIQSIVDISMSEQEIARSVKTKLTDSIMLSVNKSGGGGKENQSIIDSFQLPEHSIKRDNPSKNNTSLLQKFGMTDSQQIQETNREQIDSEDVIQSNCQSCKNWKIWASAHQKLMLSQQKELQDKETVLFDIMLKQKLWINNGEAKIHELELKYEKQQNKVKTMDQQLKGLNIKCHELQEQKKALQELMKIQGKVFSASKAQKVTILDSPTQDYTTNTRIGEMKNFMASKPSLLDQSIIERSQQVEKIPAGTPKAMELEKCLFDNQLLRDYNATLIQRLNSTKHKHSFYS